ncbi:MAG: hypothetical protein J6T57_04005 [Alphaproteobacteria bacterium]|nr:hypothetical protein [Alphaproteobacteria bacterium]
MQFIKSVSLVCISALCCGAVESVHAVNMTAQIRQLLDEKQHKMEELEKCEGKKKGFMIAGLSTIGLTAVGIGGNIALASKSNKLSNEIDEKNQKLEKKETELSQINSKISNLQYENARAECEKDTNKEYKNGQCVDKIFVVKQEQLDVQRGKVGGPCNNGAGIWIDGGDDTCVDATGHGLTKCSCKDKKSNNEQSSEKHGQNVGTVDNVMEIARYTNYVVQCNGEVERFEFIDGVPAADAQKSRILNECENGQVVEKRASVSYTDSDGHSYSASGTVIECKCDTKRRITLGASGRQMLNGTVESAPDWAILENPVVSYGLSREDFCATAKKHSGYMGQMVSPTHGGNFEAQIKNAAGIGYWCRELGGTWTVSDMSDGKYWKCDNIGNLKCDEAPVAKPKAEKDLTSIGIGIGAKLAVDNVRKNATEQNKDVNVLTSMMGGETKQLELNVPTSVATKANVEANKKAEKEAEKEAKREEERQFIVNCEASGGTPGPLGKQCWCTRSGLKQSDDKQTCECKQSGYTYDKDEKKCVAPNNQNVLNFMDELEANSKDRFL